MNVLCVWSRSVEYGVTSSDIAVPGAAADASAPRLAGPPSATPSSSMLAGVGWWRGGRGEAARVSRRRARGIDAQLIISAPHRCQFPLTPRKVDRLQDAQHRQQRRVVGWVAATWRQHARAQGLGVVADLRRPAGLQRGGPEQGHAREAGAAGVVTWRRGCCAWLRSQVVTVPVQQAELQRCGGLCA